MQVSFADGAPAQDELAFHLQARGIEIRERIYRPFLLLTIFRDLSPSEIATLGPYVQEHIAACVSLIQQWNVRHRHHGTWLMVRQSFASVLLLLAARKRGIEQASTNMCIEAVKICSATLAYWEKEAPDLKASRTILDGIARDEGIVLLGENASPL
jgi:hypothetical protein